MVIHICDRCKKEAKDLQNCAIPDFDNYGGILPHGCEIYGRPVRLIELCPDCKQKLELILTNFLKME